MQIDNVTALTYLVKMKGTHSKELLNIVKEIWNYLIPNQITITAKISTKCFEVSNKLAVQKSPCGLQQLEIRPKTFLAKFESPKSSPDRSFCVALKPPTTTLEEFYSRLPSTVLGKPLQLLATARKEKTHLLIVTSHGKYYRDTGHCCQCW